MTRYEMLKSTGRKKKPTSHDTTTEDASVRETVVALEAEVVNNEREGKVGDVEEVKEDTVPK